MFPLMYRKQTGNSITIICGDLYPHLTGGAEIFNYFLIQELAKKYKVTLLSASDPSIENVRYFKIRHLYPVRLFYPLQLLFLLFQRSRNSSVIYTSFMKASWLTYIPITIFSWISGIPYSFTIHGGGLTKWNFKLPYKFFFKQAKTITGVSDRICTEYNRRTGRNIRYLPPMIPFVSSISSKGDLRKKYNLPVEAKIVLFVGSFSPIKNPLHIINSFEQLGLDYINQHKLVIVFAGDGILKAKMLNRIKECSLDKHVYLQGNLPIESIHEMYALADYYIISSSLEGTPIALLEAMFNGLPILASDAPGINNLLKHNETALLFQYDNSLEMALRIKQLLSDPEKEDFIRSNARKYFDEKFNYSGVIEKYIKVIVDEY